MSQPRRNGESPGRALLALAKRAAELAIDCRTALAAAEGRPWATAIVARARSLASELEEAGVDVQLGRRELGPGGPELPILAAIEAKDSPGTGPRPGPESATENSGIPESRDRSKTEGSTFVGPPVLAFEVVEKLKQSAPGHIRFGCTSLVEARKHGEANWPGMFVREVRENGRARR